MNIKNFFSEDFLKDLRHLPRFTVSVDKIPTDMRTMGAFGIKGVSARDASSLFTEEDFYRSGITGADNITLWLDARLDRIMVLDIEPSCPERLKEALLRLPALYREVSSSGRGAHLVLPAPEESSENEAAFQKPALRHPCGYYEILLRHYVSFTGKKLPEPSAPLHPEDAERVFSSLARRARPCPNSLQIDADFELAPQEALIAARILAGPKFRKTPEDYHMDLSVYEFAFACDIDRTLGLIFRTRTAGGLSDSPSRRVRIGYYVLSCLLAPREKHKGYRQNLPWLAYTMKRAVEIHQADGRFQ